MSDVLLAMHEVTKSYGSGVARRLVLRGIDVQFKRGSTYAITGVSGTGKSTLMHVLAGLDAPSSGDVFFDGHAISGFHKARRASFLSTAVGLVFQSPYLISELSVQENIMMPALIAGIGWAVAAQRAHALLARVGLDDRMHDHPAALSGGQQQRVAIARAIINEPAFLLADEPTGNLDAQTGREIVDLLLTCQKDWGMGIIVTSHDAYVAKKMGFIFQLRDGLLHSV